jgi:predicted phosphodiesterase
MTPAIRRVAVLCDIHGNLPALDAVLEEVHAADADLVVIGGDVFPGPMPRETFLRLLDLDRPVQFVHGNGELGMLAQLEATDPSKVTYWGTTGGYELPEPLREIVRWSARQLTPDDARLLATWPRTLRVRIHELGEVLFCHATPYSETDAFTRLTPEDVLLPIFNGLGVGLVVCGHTHMQFDRWIGTTRVVNAGSVGMPFGRTGADWLLLGPDVQLRHTSYDLIEAGAVIRQTQYPQAAEFADTSLLNPPSEEEILKVFTRISF